MSKLLILALSSLLLISCNQSDVIISNFPESSTIDFGQGNTKSIPITFYAAPEISVPESITISPNQQVYVSNIGGKPFESIGKGFISRFSNNAWQVVMKNLDDPKGMVFINENLVLLSDHPAVKLIDLSKQKVLRLLTIANAGFLNDLAKLSDSEFVLTDTVSGDVIKISLDQTNNNQMTSQLLIPAAQLNGNGVNGVIFDPLSATLYLVTGGAGGSTTQGHIWQVKLDGNNNPIAPPERWFDAILGNAKLDGLALTKNGDKLFVSDWSSDTKPSSIFVFNTATRQQTAVIQGGFENAADITLDGTQLYLPLFTQNNIAKLDLSSVL